MRYQYLRFPGGKAKAVTFSYDDGCPQDVKFSDILTSYGLKATFNLNNTESRGSNALSKETIEEHMLSKGHEIAVHGAFHRANGVARPIEGIQDVLNCRLELEHTYGIIVRGMAYPDCGITRWANGTEYQHVKQYLTELDIVYSRTLGGDNDSFELPTDWHRWMPTAHHNNAKILDYADKFLGLNLAPNTYLAARQPRLFYVWGHAYEFDRSNNWDHLHTLCQKLAHNDEVWYATNIEIYNYVTAYQSLVYSADGTMIYNPTLYTIWLDRDGVPYSIQPGETLKV